jgi:hypothetical protein
MAMDEARRQWLERVHTATRGAIDDVAGAQDPFLEALAADLNQFAARLRGELNGAIPGELDPPRIG